ncbi:MAG: acylneuraminate cytidylyltransferase family protein [Chitinophagaceae bacterium]|nr:acylneuraminate cytidylyltransferase family protein [Chitinophagaceae bacterium]
MHAVAVIPARGGSKGIPGKNIRSLHGKPLIQYTIEAARQCFADDQILVSTDRIEIKEVVEGLGLPVPFLRPDHLALDTSGTYEVLLHALEEYEKAHSSPDILVLLQPTSPFRRAGHIREAMQRYTPDIDMVVSAKETRSNPYYVLFEEENGYLVKSKELDITRRQDAPRVWEYNGAVYVMNVQSLKKNPPHRFVKVIPYPMDETDSIDLDTAFDWMLAECLLAKSEHGRQESDHIR